MKNYIQICTSYNFQKETEKQTACQGLTAPAENQTHQQKLQLLKVSLVKVVMSDERTDNTGGHKTKTELDWKDLA